MVWGRMLICAAPRAAKSVAAWFTGIQRDGCGLRAWASHVHGETTAAEISCFKGLEHSAHAMGRNEGLERSAHALGENEVFD